MPKKSTAFFLWIASSLLLSYFHEPWRDEAQAWLVARHSETLWDLLYRSSLEATGPVYYLLFWPWARLFPEAFPTALAWVSWAGTLGAVAILLFSDLLPTRWRVWVAFGYLFGYEYAAVARLYGWGCFFLLAGFLSDLKNRKLPMIFFLSAALLTQLNFVFAALAWVSYRCKERGPRALPRYVPLLLAGALAAWHLNLGAADREWSGWLFQTSGMRLGSTLSVPFVQTPGHLGWAGIAVFFLALYPLAAPARWGILAGLAPFLTLYLFRYAGYAWSRHGARCM